MFSPWYASAIEGGHRPEARAHVALNVALYDRGATRAWIFAEHDGRTSALTSRSMAIGASTVEHEGDDVVVRVDETTSPFPRPGARRLRGQIRVRGVEPSTLGPIALDARNKHLWWPIAPRAVVDVHFPELGISFSGDGYHDANAGDEPLGAAFRSWTWGRWHLGRRTAIAYDTVLCDGTTRERTLSVGDTAVHDISRDVSRTPLGRGAWGVPLRSACDGGGGARLVRRLEDSPFYARGIAETELFGQRATGIVESLDLQRFAAPWVRLLLPFRSRRA